MNERKLRVLLIVQPERTDFYNYLRSAENIEWILLWYEKPGQMKLNESELPLEFTSIWYWTDFSTPFRLLKKIDPDRIVFFEIIDLRQIALNIAANACKIPTFYLEHGAAGDKNTAVERWKEIRFRQQKLPYLANRLKSAWFDVVRSKLFYYSVFTGFYSIRSYIKYLILPFKMLSGAPNKILTFNKFPERVPKLSIVFNQANFDEFALYTGIKHEDALFTGVPYFDQYYKSGGSVKNYIFYIDAPFMEENLCGWTINHHNHIANKLFEFAEKSGIHVYIKLHPRSKKENWFNYNPKSDHVTIIQNGDYTDLFLDSKLILGYSSSLLNGFLCARKNIVFLGWHPQPVNFGFDFSSTGLCHFSSSPEELLEKYPDWINHNLTFENEEIFECYLKRFNYPFDGKATERVINAIIQNEIS